MPDPKNDITAEFVRNLFDYDEKSAQLIWKKTVSQGRKSRGGNSKPGKVAGMIFTNGYRVIKIKINGKRRYYLAHRLIHLYRTGEWPAAHIDHKDRNPADNSQIRPATRSQNQANRGKQRNNTSGYKGVIKVKNRKNSWTARIGLHGKSYYLGFFRTPEAAYAAYCEAAKRLHGEFANFG